jgi:NAD(P)-dependent dehydrogenase (short-subunit alcohol dehydrogenase family)
MQRTALVTGANRGIGLEACRQLAQAGLAVILTARHAERGGRAAGALARDGHQVHAEQLDVTDPASVRDCARRLADRGVEVDVLVNNAGVYPTDGFFSMSEETLRLAMEVNFFGAVRTCKAFVPGMVRRGYGRVVNVSSGYGALTRGVPGPAPYSLSKAALHALTRKLAAETRHRGDIKVNAMDPGWVATDMGGRGAPVSPAEAADTLVWLATLPADGPTDGIFYRRRPTDW